MHMRPILVARVSSGLKILGLKFIFHIMPKNGFNIFHKYLNITFPCEQPLFLNWLPEVLVELVKLMIQNPDLKFLFDNAFKNVKTALNINIWELSKLMTNSQL